MISRDYQLIIAEHTGGVAHLTLNNPARRNAIGPAMVNELLYALDDALADEAVRSVVLTGAGRAFCGGGDLSQMTGGAGRSALPPKGDYADLLLALVRSTKPVVARVNGHAMGGGLGLVAASHFAVAARGARLGTPEIDVGLFPMMIMAVLRRLVPERRLSRMMLLGERLSATEAADIGLVNAAVAPEDLDGAVAELTDAVAAKSPKALELGLTAMADQHDLALEQALVLLRERLLACLGTEDAHEGLMAYLEKRKPIWQGR